MSHVSRLAGFPIGSLTPERQDVRHITWTFADSATPFASAKAKHLYDWWASANGGRMPLRRAFDVTEHRAIVPHLVLVQVLPGGRFRFQLQGERVTELLGRNDAHRTVALDDPEFYDRSLAALYRTIVDTRRCVAYAGDLRHRDRRFISIEAIDCPLSDDGVTASAILGVVDQV